jgi:CheY-like chemotaxis protein
MSTAHRQHPVPSRQATVLCIDDDPLISRLISLRLEPYGVNVVSAFFGTHGMWLTNQELPDVIITDFQMPQGNGACVIEWLKSNQRTSDIPIVVLTGWQEAGLERKLRQRGAAHFLRKPTSFEKLLKILSEYITFEQDESLFEAAPAAQSAPRQVP